MTFRVSCRYGLAVFVVNAALLLATVPVAAADRADGADGADGGQKRTLVAIGDSLTAGLGLTRTESFPVKLQTALRSEGLAVTIVNAGVSGDTSAGGRARLAWTLTSGPVDGVILELGANDGLRGLDPATTKENLAAILISLKSKGIPVLLTGMKAPPNLGDEYGAAFNALYPALAQEHDVDFYPFFLEGVAAQPILNQPDGIHPNSAGVAVIVRQIMPYVKKLIAPP